MQNSYSVKNLQDLENFAEELLKWLQDNSINCVLLYGELGVGKTALVQKVAKLFGIKQKITSPTFVIMKDYPLQNSSVFSEFIHIDAYRLKNKDDIKAFDIDNLVKDNKKLIFIEWPEKIFDVAPSECLSIRFTVDHKTAVRELALSLP